MEKKKFSTGKIALIVVGIIVLFILLYTILAYNRFITLEQNINGKWSEVENQYQRQADLIPNLVSTVSSSVRIETRFIKEVTEARSRWQTAKSDFERDAAGVQMNNGISALVNAVAVAENYPVLQANKQYIALTDELSGTQNRITVARGRYIESIQAYNIAIKRFPGNIFARLFGFSGKDYYKAELSAMETPELGTGILP
ncbi:MAG TPA: LemA family protein [Nanoarchaeota archaeon]|nr:LemA family protein [Nanoarchaeota archaeon]HIH51021.1 LemA family protein [Nanoarchaeota archaeon]HIH65891.1 LemA family protein [Nanoarchaeota archaeon]